MMKLLPYIAKPLFALFVLAVAAGVMYFSWNALGLIFPDDLAGQILGMVLFDIAMVVWFAVFLTQCKATMQYVWSVFGFIIGLLGTLALVSMEVGTSSGLLDAGTLAKPLTYVFVGVLICHLLLSYAFHASAPEQAADINIGIEKAKVTDEAQKQVEKKIGEKIHLLADAISNDLLRGVLRDLRISVRSGDVLDAPSYTVEPLTVEEDKKPVPGFLSWASKLWASVGKNGNTPAQNAAVGFPVQTQMPSPAQTDAASAAAADEEPKP